MKQKYYSIERRKKIGFDGIFLKGKINAKGLDVYKSVRKVILWKLANYSQDKKKFATYD